MGAVEVIQHHRHTHITDIELAAVVNSKHQGPFTASAANPRLPGQGLHRQITAEVGDGVEGVDHQGIQPHQGAPRVLVVQVAAVAKVQAATVQVQVFSRYGHRQPSQLRLGIPKATAIPSRAGSEIANRRHPSPYRTIPNPKVLEGGIDTPAIALGGASISHRDGLISAAFSQAEFGCHGVHEAAPARYQPKPIDRSLSQAPISLQGSDRPINHRLQRLTRLHGQGLQILCAQDLAQA